jgi:hypothetical protein
MINLIKKILGVYVSPDERRVLDAIDKSGLKSMKVVGRGTLTVDPKEVASSEKFKAYAEQAKSVVNQQD